MKVIKERKEWNNTLEENFNNSDVVFKYEYYNLYEKHYDVKSECIFWENEYIKVFWPHLIRDISKLNKYKDFTFYDLITPYGYGGPLIYVNTRDKIKAFESAKSFFEDYKKYALDNNYISEFIRFHPVLRNWEFFDGIFNIEYVNDVVIVDLLQDINNILNNIRKGHRNNIKKSIKEGCKIRFIENPSDKDISDFIKIYYNTMDKNDATQKYYFSAEFIKDHFKLLNTLLIKAEHGNNTIGMSMFIYGDYILHYHLSGTSIDTKKLYPSHLILFEAIKWANEREFKYLNLGGGRGVNDTLFGFKKGFSKLTNPFYTAKLIFNNSVYDELTIFNDMIQEPTNYFPKYRYGFDEKIL